MAANKRKQDEKHLKILRDLVTLQHNKQCFDCLQRGPTYINMTIGSFVCTSCSGILRGISPAHRVKSISMASFTPEEIDFIKSHGNEFCRQVWLGLHDARSLAQPDSREEQKIRDFMSQKYEKKRWYMAPTDSMKEEAKQLTEAMLNSKQSSANNRSIKTKLGSNSAKITISTSQPTTAKSAALPSLISSPAPTETPVKQTLPESTTNKQSATMDLLGDLGGDPFSKPVAAAAPPPTGGGQAANFTNFANFNNGPTMPALTNINATPAPLTHQTADKPSDPAATGGDKYAALLSLDDSHPAMTPASTATGGLIDWSGMGGGGVASAGMASTAMGWGSQPVKWDSPGTVSWDAPTPATAAPASSGGVAGWGGGGTAANLFSQNAGMNPFSGVSQAPPQQPAPSGGGNPFGAGNASMFGGGGGGLPQTNPGWPPQPMFTQQPSQFPPTNPAVAQGFPAQFASHNSFPTQNGSTQFPNMTQPNQFGGKGVAGGYGVAPGAWVPQAPVGNPFMNAALMQQQSAPPRSNATNPFL